MLNELFQVAEALENLGIAGKEAHPTMKPMGKLPAWMFFLRSKAIFSNG